jgi:ubiquitin-activating enzyme E1 C
MFILIFCALSNQANVLLVGAGGLGCEVVKCLAYSGFRKITVVDMDTIDISNLNRQFLFTQEDVGKPKAQVAATVINERCKHLGVHVDYRVGRIQDFDDSFFSHFFIIIAGLDNIPARRWLNSKLFDMVRYSPDGQPDPSSLKFFLDGGTEGLKGQGRVIIPTMTACFECTIDTFPPVTTYPLCTIAETPRLPEHCIEYAFTVLWDKTFKDSRKFCADDESHIDWVFNEASARANHYKIEGVTRSLTKGVVKRIIPAVASTNALIAAILVNEAFKIATYTNPVMNNYFMYMGQTGVNCETFAYEKNPNCLVCSSSRIVQLELGEAITLADLIQILDSRLRLSKPSLVCKQSGEVVLMQFPQSLRKQHEWKLPTPLIELFPDKIFDFIVTDPSLHTHLSIRFVYCILAPKNSPFIYSLLVSNTTRPGTSFMAFSSRISCASCTFFKYSSSGSVSTVALSSILHCRVTSNRNRRRKLIMV